MRALVQIALVLAVLAGGWRLSEVLAARGGVGGQEVVAVEPPLVETTVPVAAPFVPVLRGTGEVRPRRMASVVPQVSGVVLWVSPRLVRGGLVREGEPLLRIDGADLELERRRLEAEVERARARVAEEEALASQARREQELLGVETPGPLALRVPQLAAATAAVQSAEAAVDRVLADLGRLELVAPFDGAVESLDVGLGQLVQRGNRLAELSSTDVAEIVVPLRDADLRHLPFSLGAGLEPANEIPCTVEVELAGQRAALEARVDRLEGSLDSRTRMARVVLQVEDPYGLSTEREIPLFNGSHVGARIPGLAIPEALVVPREAIMPGDVLWVAAEEGRLQRLEVQVAWRDRESVVISGGLEPGSRVVVSPLANPIPGMSVRLLPSSVEVR